MIKLNKLYCSESVNFMKENIPDNFIDLTVTSPPYDDLRKYNGYKFNFENIANELYRITKENGIVVWVVADRTIKGSESCTSFKQALYFKEIGFNLHDTMIYAKENPVPQFNNGRYTQAFEYMFVLSKGMRKECNYLTVKTKNEGVLHKRNRNTASAKQSKDATNKKPSITKSEKPRNNIWHYSVGNYKSTKDKIAFNHPAIFPEQLAEDHILSWSNEGDIVFDPMCGSGTTCKMAKIHNRSFIGVDTSEEYIEIANERILSVK